MKLKLFSLLALCMSLFTNLNAQHATITFTTDIDNSVTIYEPIDGMPNHRIPTTTIFLHKGTTTDYKVSHIDSFAFIRCNFALGGRSNPLLFPNDSLSIHIDNTSQITFGGTNQAGLQYIHNNFSGIPLLEKYTLPINRKFRKYISQEKTLESVIAEINNTLIEPHIKSLDSIALATKTSANYINTIKKEFTLTLNMDIINILNVLLKNEKYKPVEQKDSIAIRYHIDSIFNKTAAINLELIKFSLASPYIHTYIRYHGDKRKMETHDKAIFGPYIDDFCAPESLQPYLLGSAAICQVVFNTGEMDIYKVKDYLNEKHPQYEHTKLLNKLMKDKEETTNTGYNKIFIQNKIDTLTQLKEIPELKGKYLFVDLWASWCMPCRGEFNFTKDLHNMLKEYKNMEQVYISIDSPKQENAWKGCILKHKLSGYHLMASAELQKNIKKLVFADSPMEIPRYFLLSPEGEILHADLPRPSHSTELKNALENTF